MLQDKGGEWERKRAKLVWATVAASKTVLQVFSRFMTWSLSSIKSVTLLTNVPTRVIRCYSL